MLDSSTVVNRIGYKEFSLLKYFPIFFLAEQVAVLNLKAYILKLTYGC